MAKKSKKKWMVAVAASFGLAVSMACATGKAVTTANPTTDQVQSARVLAKQVLAETRAGLKVANEAGNLVKQLPISVAIKDAVDCAVLKVTGVPQVTPVLTRVCGDLVTEDKAPIRIAAQKLVNVTACASLRTTVAEVLGAIDPLMNKLKEAGVPALSALGVSLDAIFAFTRQVLAGGEPCV